MTREKAIKVEWGEREGKKKKIVAFSIINMTPARIFMINSLSAEKMFLFC